LSLSIVYDLEDEPITFFEGFLESETKSLNAPRTRRKRVCGTFTIYLFCLGALLSVGFRNDNNNNSWFQNCTAGAQKES
jgi:hypothetical protein